MHEINSIVMLIRSLGEGGAERVFVTLANGLFERKWKVTLFLLNLKENERYKELNPAIERVGSKKKHARASFFVLLRWLFIYKPKKILVFSHQLAVLLVVLRFLLRMKFIIISRNINTLSIKKGNELSFWHKHIVNNFVSIFYRYVDLIIAQSQGMKEDLISNYGIKSSVIIVINNPISKKIEKYLSNNSIPLKKENYIVAVGRLVQQKAYHFAIEAFEKIILDYPLLRLKIIGTGRQELQLKQLASNLNIADKIDFEGYHEDICTYYAHANLTILTSLYEGFPNVLIESIALGTPVVSFDCPSGPSEIIQDGINGYLVRYQDTDHLTECLKRTLDKKWDPIAISSTAESFSSEKIINEYEKVLI